MSPTYWGYLAFKVEILKKAKYFLYLPTSGQKHICESLQIKIRELV